MNQMLPIRARPTTQTADGWPRISWTHGDLDRMVDAGLLREGDRVELVGGEIVPMSPKGHRHENIRRVLCKWIYQRLPNDQDLLVEPGWRPEARAYFEPDLMIVPASVPGMEIPGQDVQLLVEIADSSFDYDTSVKRDAYARLGVREYWVVHAVRLETRVFRKPSPSGYARDDLAGPGDLMTPALVPEIAVRLGDLSLG
jgi:Uma2 family endonuclease